MKPEIIDNNLGSFFLAPQKLFALVFLTPCVATLLSRNIAGVIASIFLIICAAAIFLSQGGIMIDISNYQYKSYIFLFHLTKLGTWKSLVGYQYTLVKRSNQGYRVPSVTTKHITINEMGFDVYLIKRDRRTKLLVNVLKDKKAAFDYANKMSEMLDFTYLKVQASGRRKGVSQRRNG